MRTAAIYVAWLTLALPGYCQTAPTDAPAPKKPEVKPPSVAELLQGRSQAIVITVPNFQQMDRPSGVFLPGADPARLRQELDANRDARRAGVTSVVLMGDLQESWAELTAVVEARLDDPRGGELVLNLQEAQCSAIEVTYRDPQQAAAEPAPVFPPPIDKADALAPYILRLDRPGSYRCRLTLHLAIDRGPIERRLTLTLPAAPVKSVQLRETNVRTGFRIEEARQGRTEKPAPIERDAMTMSPRLLKDESLDLRWRLSAAPASTADQTADVAVRYSIRGRKLETTTEIAATASAERSNWRIRMPAGEAPMHVQVLQEGRQLRGASFAVEPQGEEVRVRVQTAEKAAGLVRILLTTERPPPAIPPEGLAFELAPPILEDAMARRIYAVVDGNDDEEIRMSPEPRGDRGASPVPLERLEAAFASSPRAAAFELSGKGATLGVRLERLRASLAGSTITADFDVGQREASLLVELRTTVRQGWLESLRLELPEALIGMEARVDGGVCAATAGASKGGAKTWTARLGERRTGDVVLQIRGKLPIQPGVVQSFATPKTPDAPDAPIAVSVVRQPGVHVRLAPECFAQWQVVPATATKTGVKPWLTLRPKTNAGALAFAADRIRGRTAVAVEHRLRAVDGRLFVRSRFRWESFGEPLEEVVVRIPAGSPNVTIRGERLATPSGGFVVGAGERRLALAAPTNLCDVVVDYELAEPTRPSTSGKQAEVPLVLPVADSLTFCWAELLAPPGQRAAAPKGWTNASAERIEPMLLEESDPPLGLVAQCTTAPVLISWQTEAAGTLAEVVVPRLVVVEEMAPTGRRRGRMLAGIARLRSPAISLLAPPGCTIADVLLDGLPTPISPANQSDGASILHIRAPAAARPIALEVRYESSAPPVGALRILKLQSPRFVGNVAVDEWCWRQCTSGDLLLAPLDADVSTRPPNPWSVGNRLPGRSATLDRLGLTKWVEGNLGALSWSTPDAEDAVGRQWTMHGWGNDGEIRMVVVREPFWILAISGAALFLAVASLRLPAVARRILLGTVLAIAFNLWAFAPSAFSWFWIGVRWAVGAVLSAHIFRISAGLIRSWRRRRGSKFKPFRPLGTPRIALPGVPRTVSAARIGPRGSSVQLPAVAPSQTAPTSDFGLGNGQPTSISQEPLQ